MSAIETRKLWLRLVSVFLIIVSGFLVLLLAASLLFGDKAKEIIVAEINGNLLVPADVAISLPHMALKGKTGNDLPELSLDGSMAPRHLTFGSEFCPA